MTKITCKVDFNINDRLPAVRVLIGRMKGIFESVGSDDCHIDLTRCQYLGPDAVAILAAVVLERKHRNHAIRVSFPEGPAKLRAFCRWSGLESVVNGVPGPGESGETVMPLRQIFSARWSDPTPIIQLVNHYLAIADEPEEYLRICVHEVIQNIEDHAESPIGGVMCACYMSSAQQVRVAIVDRGIGICTTLKRQHADTTPENALRRVLKGKFSAMSRPNNAGLGLCNLTSMIEYLRGDFVIISEDATVEGQAGSVRKFARLPNRFPGTAVFFTLPVRSQDDDGV